MRSDSFTHVKQGRLYDPYRGDGWFVSLINQNGTYTLAARWRWHFYFIRPPGKPHVWRLYLGPFEFERATRAALSALEEGKEP